MFTGIVEAVGQVVEAGALALRIRAPQVVAGTRLGDSIAVNGVCLTVTELGDEGFSVDVVAETRRRTNLGTLAPGALVNLERALAAGDRLDGHIVQGHVEATARVVSIVPDGEATLWEFAADPALLRYVVPKGFVAVEGISVTVIDVDDTRGSFRVTIIPFTREATNLRAKNEGDVVNLETDVLGRYVERLLAGRQS